MKAPFAFALTIAWLMSPAATLWEQPVGGSGTAILSQEVVDYPEYSTYAYDDFEILEGHFWSLDRVTAYGESVGSGTSAVHLLFFQDGSWSGPPGSERQHFVQQGPAGSDTVVEIGGAITLTPGHWWMSLWHSRPFNSGEWHWQMRRPVKLSEGRVQNPGNGFGLGAQDSAVSDSIGEPPADFAFKIEGTDSLVPEPAPLIALALSLLLRRRWGSMPQTFHGVLPRRRSGWNRPKR
jgi:hypothetical protein